MTNEKRSQNLDLNDLEKIDSINDFTEKWILESYQASHFRDIITIPIVVHIIYNNDIQNISEDQIFSQIKVLNEDFRKLNSNLSSTAGSFLDIATDTEIEFCLAKFDPQGAETNGITYNLTEIQAIGNTDFWYQPSEGGTAAWNTDAYLNIWVCDLGGNGALGFASMPGTSDPIESDGVVIDYRNFGTIGSASNAQPYHLGRITTHEVGHYLNLEHLWGPGQGSCDTDDFVDDTPLQEQFSEGCPDFPSYDDCSFSGDGLNFNNFMDYTDDVCMTMFTQGQKLRMLATLNGPRVSLLSSQACTGMPSNILTVNSEKIKIWPNPAANFIQIECEEEFFIVDLNGRKVDLVKNHNLIDISKLIDGIYFVSDTRTGNFRGKFIVAH